MVTGLHQKLLKDLSHEDEDVRTLSAMTLMKVNVDIDQHEVFIKALSGATLDPNVAVRYFARKALHRLLSQHQGEDFKDLSDRALVEILTSSHPREQIQAALELGKRAKPQAGEPLLHQLKQETDSHVRSALLSALGKINQPKYLKEIKPFLGDEDPRVRSNALEACGSLEVEESDLSYLLMMLEDSDNRVRATAARILGQFGEKRIIDSLEKMLFSGEQWLRQSALHTLGEIVLPGLEKLILKILENGEINEQISCIELLSQYRGPHVISGLSSILKHENKKMVQMAEKSLIAIKQHMSQDLADGVDNTFDNRLNLLLKDGKVMKISQNGFIRFREQDQQEKYENHLLEAGHYIFGLYKEGEIRDSKLQQLGSQIIKYEFIYTQKMEEFRKNNEGKLGGFMKAIFNRKNAEDDPTIKYTVDRKKRAVIDLGLKALESFRSGECDFPLLETYSKQLEKILQDNL